MTVPVKLEDVRYADVVVIGHIHDYRIVRDGAFRKRMMALPDLPLGMREMYQDPKKNLLSDYARFNVEVEQTLVGRVAGKISVTWDNSTFGEPEQMEPGRYLIALRRPTSTLPPLRGPSATTLPNPDPTALTLLQAPCSSAFIYRIESEQARTIRSMLVGPQS